MPQEGARGSDDSQADSEGAEVSGPDEQSDAGRTRPDLHQKQDVDTGSETASSPPVADERDQLIRLPTRQPHRALSVVAGYVLAVGAVTAVALAIFATGLAAIVVIAAACGFSVAVAVLAPLPQPEPPPADVPVLLRPTEKPDRA